MKYGCAALLVLVACKNNDASSSKPLQSEQLAPAQPAALSDTAKLANDGWRNKTCTPDAAAGQRIGKANVTLHGDGVDFTGDVPALCGGLHSEATKRFAVGDGTLFRACLNDGSVVQVSADVPLTGTVNTEFRYENYKNVGPLIEFFRHDVGTYNQREANAEQRAGETIEAQPSLVIDGERTTADLRISLQWPAYKKVGPNRIINANVHWECPAAK
ncbi:MAG TPA: hypothetical protein PLF40_16330 [Kofleriaceae bacterium]|nr:hypothetical protein [Kofleriaceae bacterium]